MTYSGCLHDQQDLFWGNTSRDTSEESQESQKRTANKTSTELWFGRNISCQVTQVKDCKDLKKVAIYNFLEKTRGILDHQ